MKYMRFLAAMLIATMLLAGCGVSPDKYPTTVAATYGDKTTYMDEANFWLRYNQWNYEAYYISMASYYAMMGYGAMDPSAMWQGESGNRTQTMSQYMKETVMAEIRQTYLLLDHADEYGVSLSDADREKIATTVAAMHDSYADSFFDELRVSDEQIVGYLEQRSLAMRVWDAVRAQAQVTIADEDCDSFTVEFFRVTGSESHEGHDHGDKEIPTGEELVAAIEAEMKKGTSAAEIQELYEVTPTKSSFVRSDATQTAVAFTEGAALADGEVVVKETDGTGWYIIRCVSTHDEDATASKRKSLDSEKREEYFNEVYAGWEAQAASFETSSAWNAIELKDILYVEKTTAPAQTTQAGDAQPGSEAQTEGTAAAEETK